RYLARLGYAELLAGRVKEATSLRGQIGWYGDKDPDPPPILTLLDAEFLIIYCVPGDALDKLESLKGLRATRLRGRALYDQGKAAEAVAELDGALEAGLTDVESQVWRAVARLVAAKSRKEQRDADAELDKLARNRNSKTVRSL